jgi:hypothetical protein
LPDDATDAYARALPERVRTANAASAIGAAVRRKPWLERSAPAPWSRARTRTSTLRGVSQSNASPSWPASPPSSPRRESATRAFVERQRPSLIASVPLATASVGKKCSSSQVSCEGRPAAIQTNALSSCVAALPVLPLVTTANGSVFHSEPVWRTPAWPRASIS